MEKPFKIRLGTRGSQLALTQSRWVQKRLEELGVEVELVMIKTSGDLDLKPLVQIGGDGAFTKQLQIALLNNEIDLAVHSLKDLPTIQIAELIIAAVPCREDRSDVLIHRQGVKLAQLPAGAVIGSGSVRRAAQILRRRPDLLVREIRGNVETRLAKLQRGDFDAILLAAAGLNRLGLVEHITEIFPTDFLLPAVGQGALGLETRSDDKATIEWVSQLNDRSSYLTAMAERAMLRRLYAGCLSPVGVDTKIENRTLVLTGIVLSPDGQQICQATAAGPAENAIEIGHQVADDLIQQGAQQLVANPSTGDLAR